MSDKWDCMGKNGTGHVQAAGGGTCVRCVMAPIRCQRFEDNLVRRVAVARSFFTTPGSHEASDLY